MLATSPQNVIHISGVESKRHVAQVTENTISEAAGKYKDCDVYTDCMDCDILETIKDLKAYSNDQAVERAKQSVSQFKNTEVHYSLLYCNCEHWVSFWR